MGRSHRPQRLAEEIKKIVGDLLLKGRLKDPRFQGMIAVSGVDVSGDGSYATLYITAMAFDPTLELGESEKKSILSAFENSAGFIRSELGKNMKVRHVPELIFAFDNSFEYGKKMDAILDKLDIRLDEPEEEEEDIEDKYR
ncbi:MAG: 30S ribosome-binding factor RbfA [Firmicutes bacterium]|nr:30S ribosome-binding factor RbfA [Bacillota bacterium]